MNRRTAIALCCAGLLGAPAFAGDEPKTPECCSKKGAKVATQQTKLRCSLTGREVDKCCCEPREGGKMHCTLADKDVERCCCTEVKPERKEAK